MSATTFSAQQYRWLSSTFNQALSDNRVTGPKDLVTFFADRLAEVAPSFDRQRFLADVFSSIPTSHEKANPTND